MPSGYDLNLKPPAEIMAQILQQLHQFHPLSAGLIQALTEHSFETCFKKDEFLVRQGEYCTHFYFLVRGIVSGYRDKGGKKLVTFICLEGDVVSAIGGMYGNAPADEHLIATEDCYLVALSTVHLLEFFNCYPELNIIMRKILEIYYKCAHERAIISRMGTATEKYHYYLKILPGHMDKVPVETAASFLDMHTETLLKIRKTLEKQKTTRLTPERLAELNRCMLNDGFFRQKKLSLKTMAEYLGISNHELSFLLNKAYNQNFSDFINTHRVNFVKEQLKSKINFQQTTIEALGHQAGFSSKSTFFAAFKKQTGLTPLVYANKIK